ncbi:16S rRNA (adenine(1518)-N(6)/adenine(1519)-N(6))-dimethyltransferase RsmA [Liberibacter crescens]|nr:16S rRNA (adenine(1518)-N(6)/adenine(1519)-N(6))-dimethyltransferase RsmA [Liberibacter crescens]AMC13309.1 ribosomal RNA small subunit methyltransferase A [Liberibacter crescens]
MTDLNPLNSLRKVISLHNLNPNKIMGQNFILDLNLTQKIAKAAGPLNNITVLEIGPGPGGLTRSILASGAKKVIAIEKDKQFLPALQEIIGYYPDQLEIIQGDALKTDYTIFNELDDPIRVISNLPYNIGTRLLFDWITSPIWPPFWESLTLLFQKEVAKRIVATKNNASYGILSVLTAWRANARILFDIPPQAFFPSPQIISTVVHFVPHHDPIPCCLESLKKVTKTAFGQRRKMLRQSLKNLGGESLLKKARIEPSKRAENLSIEEFCRIASFL